MTIEATTRLNDVAIEAVVGLAGAITEKPDVAQTTWQARVDWKGGFRSEATIREFAPVASDEPIALGGTDTAPNPVEQLLGALGNCLAVGYAANATAAGIELTDLRIELEGNLDLHTFLGLRPGHAGYSGIRANVYIEADATDDQIRDLHDTVVSTSPVGHTLEVAVPLRVELG